MRYYGIDMGDSFLIGQKFSNKEQPLSAAKHIWLSGGVIFKKKPVALNVYNFLKTLTSEDLSIEQIRALKRVQYTLQRLLHFYPAEVVFGLWIFQAEAIDYIYTEYKKMYLRMLLHYNMYWVQRVLDTIGELVA